jgi:hypothetical protein
VLVSAALIDVMALQQAILPQLTKIVKNDEADATK